ncbi:MAG: sirohydrochlorin cobaltochelatase [Tannerellaceae bacterium]|nr:sirohydrochlorin cobaltochelatase [Tannerellaceae bacterium]
MKQICKYMLTVAFAVGGMICNAHDHGNFTHASFFGEMQPGDKAALLMVHFGSTHNDTRNLTIDPLNEEARQTFGNQLEVREAWTSRIVIRRMKERGVEKPNPTEALHQLKKEGFTHILIQSSNIIEGIEMEALRREVALIEDEFKDIRIGNPLLYTPEDYETTIRVLTENKKENGAVVWVGHGTYLPATAQYTMLDYMLKANGYTNYHVGTIEGYPALEDVVNRLKATHTKEVLLVPFMFVAGEHAKNDIAEDWVKELEKNGFEVSVQLQGLGEIPGIRKLFIDHIRFITGHKMLDIMDKKKAYAAGADKHEQP